MSLRSALLDLTRTFSVLELCYIRETVDTLQNTVTVEPVNRPDFDPQKPNVNNFIYNIKYSSSMLGSITQPLESTYAVVGFINPNDGFVLLTDSTKSLTVQSPTGTSATISIDDVTKQLKVLIKELVPIKDITTKTGDYTVDVEKDNIYNRTKDGAILNIKKDIDILAAKDGKVRVAVQTNKVFNSKVGRKSFYRPDNVNNIYKSKQNYNKCIADKGLLTFCSALLNDRSISLYKQYNIVPGTNSNIQNILELISIKKTQLSSDEFTADFDNIIKLLDDASEQIIKEPDFLSVSLNTQSKDKIRLIIDEIVSQFVTETITTSGETLSGTVIVIKPDKEIFENFNKFKDLYNSFTNFDNKDVNSLLLFMITNSEFIGYYYSLVELAYRSLTSTFVEPQTVITLLQNYYDKYKDVGIAKIETDILEEEITSTVNKVNDIETTVSLFEVIKEQNTLILNLTETIKNLINSGAVADPSTHVVTFTGLASFTTNIEKEIQDLDINSQKTEELLK